MDTPPQPSTAAETEFDLMGALFSPAGSADPQVILRGSPLPGCQYPFVRDVLRDPRFAERTITAIAYEAGFGDLSYFNRAFRRRYGETPSDVRAAAVRFLPLGRRVELIIEPESKK